MDDSSVIKGVIFDFDGTLVDSLPGIHAGWKRAFESLGLVPPTLDQVRRAIGPTREEYVKIMLGDVSESIREQALNAFREIYKKESMFSSVLFPGITALLDGLEAKGLKLAIASNKPQQQILKLVDDVFKMKDRFAPVLGPECVAFGKPAPDLFLACADAFGFSPANCVVVGDTPLDLDAGKAAGMRRIAVGWGYGERSALLKCKPEFIVERPEDILSLV